MKKIYTLLVASAIFSTISAQNGLLSGAQTGNPLTNVPIYNFEFVYDHSDLVLAVASFNTGRIYAIDFNSSTSTGVHDWNTNDVPGILSSIASIVGTTSGNLDIWDMEVNPKTNSVLMLIYHNTQFTTFLIEVKNPSDISLVTFNNVTYSTITYTTNNNYIFDMAWDDSNRLYYTTGDFTLDAEIGYVQTPFTHNTIGDLQATTLFKSNWGGNYFTNAPLEMISVSDVDGVKRLMGVTTCAPGFSIPTTDISNSGGVLSVTEDFNVRNDNSLSVVTVTQVENSITTTYLFDLHRNLTNPGPTQLIRVGEKYLDGSRVTANEFNIAAQEIRTASGAMTPGLQASEAEQLSTGFQMIAKYSEYALMVVDNNGDLRLIDVTVSTVGIEESISDLKKVNIFPSPANDFIQIEMDLEEGYTNIVLDIFSASGKRVFSTPNWNTKVDVSSFSSGTYLAKLIQGNKVVAQQKFLVH